jgi:hypothetical protein
MLRYEVVTPAGFAVGVPKRIWMAWPKGHRRLMDLEPEEIEKLENEEKFFNAEEMAFSVERIRRRDYSGMTALEMYEGGRFK